MVDVALRHHQLDRTRAAITDAATALFTRQGFGPTTVEQIAEAAGVSRRTFFRHFPTKEAVLFHDIDAHTQAVIDELRRNLATRPPFVALVDALRATVETFATDRVDLLVRIAGEDDHLLEHHRSVVMHDLEVAVTEVVCGHLGRAPDDVAITAGVAAILAAFGSAVRGWIVSGATGELATWLDLALAGVLEAVASVTDR